MTTHIFGIRHHGPGSARSLLRALYDLVPDIILIEGPPDANHLIPLFGHEELEAPVAMLVYVPDEPKFAAYYPFAHFSPEFQALRFALENDIPARFMDLPQRYVMRMRKDKYEEALAKREANHNLTPEEQEALTPPDISENDDEENSSEAQIRSDPLGELAKGAGYQDGERWWDHFVENRADDAEIFAAVMEAMTAIRDEGILSHHPLEDQREAYMRRIIHEARREGYQRIAVICGAWHAPALHNMPSQKHDNDILKGMKRIKVDATLTPWTHSRLTMWSGYGAGIWSPGWYQHLWESTDDQIAIRWLTKVAKLLREEDLNASPAQVIDAVRLAETLAAIRQSPSPSLEEFNEAALAVFCGGNTAPLRIIYNKLIVGEKLGVIPDETPMMPLERDLRRQQKRLRLKVNTEASDLKLDLREAFHLERSHLLHRLNVLGVAWGIKDHDGVARSHGTFAELWKLQWKPELTIKLIEKSAWGNTVYDAATAFAKKSAKDSEHLPQLTALVNEVLLSNLPDAVGYVVRRLQIEASATGDIRELMVALPQLADVMTYGNVRETDVEMVKTVVDGMVTRTCIGLPTECAMLDDDAAEALFMAILRFNNAIYLLNSPDYTTTWQTVLQHLMTQDGVHGMIRGRACRILLDANQIDAEDARRQMRLAMSPMGNPTDSVAWLEGFLFQSGLILIHDEYLLTILDEWVMSLQNADFEGVLPLLRRTFSSFEDPERRQIGRIISGRAQVSNETDAIDEVRADAMLPILSELLGIDLQLQTEAD